jgi:hypothetical protein
MYTLDNDTKVSEYIFTLAQIYRFTNNRVLVRIKGSDDVYRWKSTDTKLTAPLEPYDKYDITKKMTELEVRMSYRVNTYSLKTKIMIASSPILKTCSVRWNDNDEAEILPFTPLHTDDNIAYILATKNFSPDGCWFDKTVDFKSNGIRNLEGRVVYHVGAQYPIGVSPPIQLGLCGENAPTAFMLHDKLGPCYVMQDAEDNRKVKVFKLNEGLSFIDRRLREYL